MSSPSGFPFAANAATEPVEIGAYPTHEGEESPEERTCEDVRQGGPGDGEKVNTPGDEEAPKNDAGVPKKK